jgi:hypothetical protein
MSEGYVNQVRIMAVYSVPVMSFLKDKTGRCTLSRWHVEKASFSRVNEIRALLICDGRKGCDGCRGRKLITINAKNDPELFASFDRVREGELSIVEKRGPILPHHKRKDFLIRPEKNADGSDRECLLCHRVTASEVARAVHKLCTWRTEHGKYYPNELPLLDKGELHEIFIECLESIRRVYSISPTAFCGCRKGTILAGILLITFSKHKVDENSLPKCDVAGVLNISVTTVGNSLKLWQNILSVLGVP